MCVFFLINIKRLLGVDHKRSRMEGRGVVTIPYRNFRNSEIRVMQTHPEQNSGSTLSTKKDLSVVLARLKQRQQQLKKKLAELARLKTSWSGAFRLEEIPTLQNFYLSP